MHVYIGCLFDWMNNAVFKLQLSFKSNAKPSTYGYPAPLEEKKKEAGEKVTIYILISFFTLII